MMFTITKRLNGTGKTEPVGKLFAETINEAAEKFGLPLQRLRDCIGPNGVSFHREPATNGSCYLHFIALEA